MILDVVYNHLGASGVKAIEAFGPYFTERHETPWGRAVNLDDADCDPVREWLLQSAEGWVRDLRVDGLRLDAIHALHDESARPVLRELADRVHGRDHRALVIAESGQNDPRVIRPASEGGFGHDAVWADDFHHALRVLVTGERGGWYDEFGRGRATWPRPSAAPSCTTASTRASAAGASARPPPTARSRSSWSSTRTTTRSATAPSATACPAAARPLAALVTLLSPFTPMLFMGEEHGEAAPFQFFSDHIDEEIAAATREGRRREFAAFAAFAGEEVPDPQDPATFRRSKLDPPAATPRCASSTAGCSRCAASSSTATRARSGSPTGARAAGSSSGAARRRSSRTSGRGPPSRCPGRAACASPPTTPTSTTTPSSCPRSPARW